MRFSTFLLEGGWSKTVTQGVKLTPEIAKKAISKMPKFEKDFNAFLKKNNYAPIKIGKPIGSTTYYEKDLANNPSKEYGDIDIIFSIPRIQGLTDSKNAGIYRKLVVDFISTEKPKYLYDDGEQNGQNIIVDVDNEWVQVDLVSAFEDLEDWTTHRMTPEHNLKGAFIGFLYASLAEALNLSINTSGVQAKHVGNDIVPFKRLKVDRVDTLSTDISQFGVHVLEYLYSRMHGKNKPIVPAELKNNSGMNRSEIKFIDLAKMVSALGNAFEKNNMWGVGDLQHIESYSQFISRIKQFYERRVEEAATATKFNKAITPEAKKRAQDTKDLLVTKSKELLKLIK